MSNLETALNKFLLRDVNFILDSKIIKSGNILLFNHRDYYITFTLKIDGSTKIFEIPSPFHFHFFEKSLLFDYKLESLYRDDLNLKIKFISYKTPKQSKLLNNCLKIEYASQKILS